MIVNKNNLFDFHEIDDFRQNNIYQARYSHNMVFLWTLGPPQTRERPVSQGYYYITIPLGIILLSIRKKGQSGYISYQNHVYDIISCSIC